MNTNFRCRPAVLPVLFCLLRIVVSFGGGDYCTNTVPYFYYTLIVFMVHFTVITQTSATNYLILAQRAVTEHNKTFLEDCGEHLSHNYAVPDVCYFYLLSQIFYQLLETDLTTTCTVAVLASWSC